MPEIKAIEYACGKLRLLDQTRLPQEQLVLELESCTEVVDAIKKMQVRGAPALGVVAAYAMALAAQESDTNDRASFLSQLEEAGHLIVSARPTAINMVWAVEQILNVARKERDMVLVRAQLLASAKHIHEQDERRNRRLAGHGACLMPDAGTVLTHCNTGALATAGYGTALGVIRAGWEGGKRIHVIATETRPFLQGARLTAWELLQLGIPSTLVVDSAAGALMRCGRVNCVIVGADRIAANGDVANKIGTYSLAVLARENHIPFYVAAPTSSVDLNVSSGNGIPIEERPADEVTGFGSIRTAPDEVEVSNPAFDITPHKYVCAIVTERGVLREPYTESLSLAVRNKEASRKGIDVV